MRRPISVHDLKALVRSYHSLVAIETLEEERVTRLLIEASLDLQLPLFDWSVAQGLARVPTGPSIYETQDALAALRHIASTTMDAVWHLKDFGPQLENAAVRRTLREIALQFQRSKSMIVVSGDPVELPRDLSHLAVRVELELPSESDLLEVVRTTVRELEKRQTVQLDVTRGEMRGVISALRGLTLNQARQAVARAVVDDGRLDAADIASILDRKMSMIRSDGLLEFHPAGDNPSELGGLANLKAWLQKARSGFSDRARAMNLRPPKGVLIVGVQGCGKSLAAKFIAREWGLPLLKLDAGRLYDKYVGESEKNLRRATRLAESMAPAVLWIDEIEKAFGNTSGDMDGGLSRRLLGGFLTWLQEKKGDVFVVGAANDVLSLPPELLRKGRFDEIFFVDLPNAVERATIFHIHLRLRKLDPSLFDLDALVAATEGFSGAEIEQAVIGAAYASIHRESEVTTDLLLEESRATVPLSVSRAEDVAKLQEMARGRFVPAS